MTPKSFALAALLLGIASAIAAPLLSKSDKWWTYIADYDGKPGSTRVDMGLREEAPLATLPTLVVFGTKYEQKPETGFPTDEALDKLNAESDSHIKAVLNAQTGIYVGTFTHNGEQVHYVYARTAEGTEQAFRQSLARSCPKCEAVYRARPDPAWNAYLKFLYPNQATLQHHGLDPRTLRPAR
jgi:Family of unknown function (DUF695)